MSTALVFPGQGSQTVGMGKALAEAFPAAREVFDRVDAALGQKLSALMFEGPEAELTLTVNAQPALLSTSIATLRVLKIEKGFDPASQAAFAAGHSLGEYSALCAADSLTLEDAARLLRLRGEAMQRAVPLGEGAMPAGVKRTLRLPVSAPFHCALMQPAADAMEAALRGVDIRPPKPPLVSNVEAEAVADPEAIRSGLV